MPQQSLIASLGVACLALSASCFNEAKAPTMAPTRVLSRISADTSASRQGPVTVLFHEPNGAAGSAKVFAGSIGVVFDRPVRRTSPPVWKVASGAPVAGSWRWVGQSAAFFAPAAPLANATEFDVNVPAGVAAEDGTALAAPYAFRFSTEPPRLVSLEPKEGQIPTSAVFEIRYNQSVSPEEVLRTAELTVGPEKGRKIVPLAAHWASPDSKAKVVLSPRESLPPGISVSLKFDATLHGLDGPLLTGKSEHFEMRTRGPLEVVSAERSVRGGGDRCAVPSVALELSNPVTVRELKAHTRFEPPAVIEWDRNEDDDLTKIDVAARLSPSQKYELVITAGMKDVYGQALARTAIRTLDVGHAPWLQIGDQEVFELDGPGGAPRPALVASANLAAYDLLVQPLTEGALVRYFGDLGPAVTLDPMADAHRRFPQAKTDVVRSAVSLGIVETRRVALSTLLASDQGRGAALIVAATEGPTRAGAQLNAARVVTQTNLGITARLGLRGGVAWVTHLSDATPVGGATLSIRDASAGELASARTNELGAAVFARDAYSPVGELGALDPHAVLIARSGDDWTFRPIRDALELDCKEPELGRESLTGLVFTDRDVYELGDTISLKALFKDERGDAGRSLSGRAVHVSATGAQGNLVAAVDGKLDSYGGFTTSVRLPNVERPGPWVLRADVLSPDEHASGTAETRVYVVSPRGSDAPSAPKTAASPGGATTAVPKAARADSRSAQLTIVSDHDVYKVGETANIRIESPFADADAFLSVEGSGAPRGERIRASGSSPGLSVPITGDMAPSAHLSVLLIRRIGGKEDVAPLAVGDLDLRVDPAGRRLKVVITPGPKSSESEFLDSDVVVTDAFGSPARSSVTFYAVEDHGERVPDLYASFEASPAPSSYWIESRADLGKPIYAERRPLRAVSKIERMKPALEERPGRTAFFDGSLLTDPAGRVHVHFHVPDGVGTLRLVAVAAGEGARFGAGETVIDASPPLEIVAEAPPVVRAGDAFTVTAAVAGRGLAGKATVTLSTIGLRARGDLTREVTLRPGTRVVTSWPFVAPEVGKAEVVLRVRAGDLVAETRIRRSVVAPTELETLVLYGESASASTEGLGRFGKVRSDVGALDLKVGASPLVGLDDGLEQILKFPYVDTEQHVTRLVVILALADIVRDYRVSLADGPVLADKEIAAIVGAQTGDGSFAAWPGTSGTAKGEEAWRSIYALWALNLASQHDHPIPSDALTRGLAFVRSALARGDRTPRERAEAAFALDVLADLGFPDIEKMEALFQARAYLPLFARALLAHAMTVAQMDNGMVDDLLADAESHLRSTPEGATVADAVDAEYASLGDSDARGTAMLLRAFVARAKARAPNVFKKIRPPELVSRVARGLLAARRGGTWRTPEETIWALRALDDYRSAHVLNHPDVDGFFYLNGQELLKMPLRERSEWQHEASFGMRKVLGAHGDGGILGFRVKGGETVYYETRLRYAPADLPLLGIDSGYSLEKRFTRLASEGVPSPSSSSVASLGPLVRGERVVVDIAVVTPTARDHVVVDDPLPGGLLPIPGSDSPSDASSVDSARIEIRPDRIIASFDHVPAGIVHVRYVAEAVFSGRYVVPRTRVVSVYNPEVFGATEASAIEVKER